jgi:hypothetical protein
MSRVPLPFEAGDIATVAKRLRDQLIDRPGLPSHVEMLNMLARSAGYRNFQHFRADSAARARLEERPASVAESVDHIKLMRLARHFGRDGRLMRWPIKRSYRQTCLWVLWSRIPARLTFTEREINEILANEHGFGDHALLRRELYESAMLWRPADCSAYRRVEREPPPEALVLIRHIKRDDERLASHAVGDGTA